MWHFSSCLPDVKSSSSKVNSDTVLSGIYVGRNLRHVTWQGNNEEVRESTWSLVCRVPVSNLQRMISNLQNRHHLIIEQAYHCTAAIQVLLLGKKANQGKHMVIGYNVCFVVYKLRAALWRRTSLIVQLPWNQAVIISCLLPERTLIFYRISTTAPHPSLQNGFHTVMLYLPRFPCTPGTTAKWYSRAGSSSSTLQ